MVLDNIDFKICICILIAKFLVVLCSNGISSHSFSFSCFVRVSSRPTLFPQFSSVPLSEVQILNPCESQ